MTPRAIVRLADVAEAELLALTASVGWNQTALDWRRTLRLSGPLAIGHTDGLQLLSSAVCVPYDQTLSWVAMVLTRVEHRGRGLATSLLERLLAESTTRTLGLDATTYGAPIYRRLGFVDHRPVCRYLGHGQTEQSEALPTAVDFDLDLAVTGACRTPLLRLLARDGPSAALGDGSFVLLRPGANAWQLGPLVATNEITAARLLRWALARIDGPVFWDLLPQHNAALELACHHGFTLSRELVRMYRGPVPLHTGDPYAIAGFEYG
jgi:GNAT superfamily N-acetyltransferase